MSLQEVARYTRLSSVERKRFDSAREAIDDLEEVEGMTVTKLESDPFEVVVYIRGKFDALELPIVARRGHLVMLDFK
jgi:hypothetical protein